MMGWLVAATLVLIGPAVLVVPWLAPVRSQGGLQVGEHP